VENDTNESSVASTGEESSRTPTVNGQSEAFEPNLLEWLKTFMAHFTPLRPPKRLLRTIVKQSTLYTVSVAIGSISVLFIGIALSTPRPPNCRPTVASVVSDDGFWVFLSQLPLAILTIYCSVVPLLRHDDFPVSKSKFLGAAGLSVAMCALAPILYAWSWEASTACSYLAGVAALFTSVQLAGGIEGRTRGRTTLPLSEERPHYM
jgi:hypothetical protein